MLCRSVNTTKIYFIKLFSHIFIIRLLTANLMDLQFTSTPKLEKHCERCKRALRSSGVAGIVGRTPRVRASVGERRA